MDLVKMKIEYPEHGMVVLTNEGGDTYTSKSEELIDFLDRVKPFNLSDASTRTFRFSGICRGKKFVQEIEIIAGDQEGAISYLETTYPHLTWRIAADIT